MIRVGSASQVQGGKSCLVLVLVLCAGLGSFWAGAKKATRQVEFEWPFTVPVGDPWAGLLWAFDSGRRADLIHSVVGIRSSGNTCSSMVRQAVLQLHQWLDARGPAQAVPVLAALAASGMGGTRGIHETPFLSAPDRRPFGLISGAP